MKLMENLTFIKETLEENKKLKQEIIFYKSLAETYKTKSAFMEDTLRDILHYKLKNPSATTKELNERGHQYVNQRKAQASASAVSTTATPPIPDSKPKDAGFAFTPVEVSYASQFLKDHPMDWEPFEKGFAVEG